MTVVMVLGIFGCGTGDGSSGRQCDSYQNGICIHSEEHNCGDGHAYRGASGDGCDDGNQASGDGCSETCKLEPGWDCDHDKFGEPDVCSSRCGDGRIVGDEVCDTMGNPYCADCLEVNGSCGDGVIQEVEGCESGDATVEHCLDCKAEFSWVCRGVPSVCTQSGLREGLLLDELTANEIKTFCEWEVAIVGGPRQYYSCRGGTYRTNTVDECIERHSSGGSYGGCTVSDLHAWAASWNEPCDLLTGSPPECLYD